MNCKVFDHGGMAEPAFPLLFKRSKRIEKLKEIKIINLNPFWTFSFPFHILKNKLKWKNYQLLNSLKNCSCNFNFTKTSFAQTYNISLNLKKVRLITRLQILRWICSKSNGTKCQWKWICCLGFLQCFRNSKRCFNLEAKYSYLGTNVSMMGQNFVMASDADISLPLIN